MKKILICACVCLLSVSPCVAWEWQEVHRLASSIPAREAAVNAEKNPGSGEALYLLALVNLRLHQDTRASVLFQKIRSVDPQSMPALWGEAEVLRRQHKLAESLLILDTVIEKSPAFYPAYITKAYISYLQGDFKGAVLLAQRVIENKEKIDRDTHVRALVILAGARGLIAHYAGPVAKLLTGTSVLPTLKKAEKIEPGSAVVKLSLGAFYLLAPRAAGGNAVLARKYLQDAIEADPLLADAYVRLAQAYKAAGDDKKYNAMLKKAQKIDPGNELARDVSSGRCFFVCK
jgi:tetratricopeptide (TPR) repeat protein